MFYNVFVSFHKDYVKVNNGEIEIGIMTQPLQGKANEEIIKKIAKHFDIPKSNVKIVAGTKSRNKVVEIT